MASTRRLCLPVLLLLAAPLPGQEVRDPRPGPPPPPPVGTSRISGQVVAADTGTPVKRAAVNLVAIRRVSGPPLERMPSRGGVSVGPVPLNTLNARGMSGGAFPPQVTDDAGRFEFGELPAGMYSVMVAPRSGFVRPPRSQQIEVDDGKTATLVVRLERTGVITGRLLDESGEPLSRARVSAVRRERLAGGRLVNTGMGATTDDLGQFRLFDLPPGEYFVTGADTFYGPISMMNTAGPTQGYAPTYFPGSASLDAARPVVVKSGQETPGIEFSLVRVTMGRISGTLRDSAGQAVAARGSVSVARRGDDAVSFNRGASVRPDGSFVITDIPPGDYHLVASVQVGEGPNAAREGVYVPVSVNGNDASIDLQTNRGATVRGRVVVEGTLQPLPAPAGARMPSAPRVMIQPRPMAPGGGAGMASGMTRPVEAADDGTFEVTGLRGPVLLTATGMRMALKSVSHGAEDLTARPMEFKGTERVNNVLIVLTHDVGSIEGTVTGDGGEPAPGAAVIIFPEDETRWFQGSPFVHVGRAVPAMPASASRPPHGSLTPGAPPAGRRAPVPGSFAWNGLLPGRYLVAALDGEDRGMPATDRESLERLRKHAVVATVTVGAAASVHVQVTKTF